MNFIYLEKVIFDFINVLLFNKDLDKKIRVYFRLTLINTYIERFIIYPEIKIFYDERYENPFNVKFPFICCFEDLYKKEEYLEEMENLDRGKGYCECVYGGYCICVCEDSSKCVCDVCGFCKRESLFYKYFKLVKLLYERIKIEYYKKSI